MLTRHSLGTYQGIELTRNSSVNTRPQSSQFAEPLWTDPGIKSEISVRELISTKKGREKERKVQAGNRQTFPPNARSEEKATTESVKLFRKESSVRLISFTEDFMPYLCLLLEASGKVGLRICASFNKIFLLLHLPLPQK